MLSEHLCASCLSSLPGPSVLRLGRLSTPVVAEVLKPWLWAGAAEALLLRGLLELLSLRRGRRKGG